MQTTEAAFGRDHEGHEAVDKSTSCKVQHGTRLYRYALLLLAAASRAEEAVQDASAAHGSVHA